MKQKHILLLIFTLLILFLLSGIATFAQTIHVIGIVDNKSDERISGNKYVKYQLRELAKNLSYVDFKIDTLFISDDMISDTAFIFRKIRTLKVEKDDSILCYTAAHGYNKGNEVYPTIRLGLTNRSDISIGKLKNILNEKKARFCVLVNESCNATHKNRDNINNNEPRSLFNIEALKHLFLDSKGTLLMLSCSLNQKSIITEDGGVFAHSFFTTLREQFYSGSPLWEIITQKTVILTQRAAMEYENFQQNPYVENNITYQSSTSAEEDTEKDIAVNVTINPYRYGDFEIEIKTEKGRNDLTYYKCDTLRYWFKTSKPCFLRVVDIWPDDRTCLLLDNYKVDTSEVGKWIEIKAPNNQFFQCTEPFGTDYLISFASAKPFCALNLKIEGGIPFLRDDFKNAIECSRGMYLMGSTIVLEDRLKIITKDRLGVVCR